MKLCNYYPITIVSSRPGETEAKKAAVDNDLADADIAHGNDNYLILGNIHSKYFIHYTYFCYLGKLFLNFSYFFSLLVTFSSKE